MRTADEILTKLTEKKDAFFSFYPEILVPYLPYEQAKSFLNPEVTADGWHAKVLDRAEVVKEMAEYMAEYGWDKALNHRGLSANRSVDKMEAWAWLLGEDALVEKMEATDYAQYGAPKLKVVCEHMGFPLPTSSDAVRMMAGEPCRPDCDEGCGS